MTQCIPHGPQRQGAAVVEFAFVSPLLVLLLLGLWEVGRMMEVQNVMWNGAREAAREASMGQSNLQTVATNLANYLQQTEPSAFAQGHPTSLVDPSTAGLTLAANTSGYTCWDNTANRELFTITFANVTNTNVGDPTGMGQLDHFQITIHAPYSSFGWLPVPQITGQSRVYVTVDWASLVDSPFQITPYLPPQ